eukprot:TRINITY_DN45485_c0_g1_i1.p2 TRINITY_DN45485_c0_g1~~TRINITY_DN45485_c0_g1_i1.p2  ORF type:complete len:129 (+),score=10.06 TRINITY_DN45485_c0_g1_i1:36-389(+)
MELIARLEERFDKMLNKIKQLEEENQFLLEELEQERNKREEVRSRIESLLGKVETDLEQFIMIADTGCLDTQPRYWDLKYLSRQMRIRAELKPLKPFLKKDSANLAGVGLMSAEKSC